MIQIEKLGIFLSKPVAVMLVFIYLMQSGLLVFLVSDKLNLERQIDFQQSQIRELEEKLRIYKVIDEFQTGYSSKEVGELTQVIYAESKRYNYDPLFVLSVILVESSFRKDQVSSKGALGLMQMKPSTGEHVAERAGLAWQGPPTLEDHETNIKLGTRYLFEKILVFRDVEQALIAYNLGETRLKTLLRSHEPIPSAYTSKVMQQYRQLKERYDS